MPETTGASLGVQFTLRNNTTAYWHRNTNVGNVFKPVVPSRYVKKRLHGVITLTLSELREQGHETIVNLTFYELIKIRMKSFAPSNHSIAVYLIRHCNEFKVKFGERQSTHIRGIATHWRDIELL